MLNFDIQNHRPLREMVYEELKMQILTGTIIPGTRMMEVELAEGKWGVSRNPDPGSDPEAGKKKGLSPSSHAVEHMLLRSLPMIWWRYWKYARIWKDWQRSLQHLV